MLAQPLGDSPLSWRTPHARPRLSEAVAAMTGLAVAMIASVASLGCDRRPPPAPIFVPAPAPAPIPIHYARAPSPARLSPMPASTRNPPVSTLPSPMPAPTLPLASAPVSPLRITVGDVIPSDDRASIREPKVRGYLADSTGDTATLAFTYRGPSHSVAAMASGDTRAQLALVLRAQDPCNVILVTWSIEPVSDIAVQLHRDRGESDTCSRRAPVRVRPSFRAHPSALGVPEWSLASRNVASEPFGHELRASIVGDKLEVFADQRLVWRGTLPPSARELRGPSGFRTDNVAVDLALRGPVDGEPSNRASEG